MKPPDILQKFGLREAMDYHAVVIGGGQPANLTLKGAALPVNVNLARCAGVESRYCPAVVYEFVGGDDGSRRLQINAQNWPHYVERAARVAARLATHISDWTAQQSG